MVFMFKPTLIQLKFISLLPLPSKGVCVCVQSKAYLLQVLIVEKINLTLPLCSLPRADGEVMYRRHEHLSQTQLALDLSSSL